MHDDFPSPAIWFTHRISYGETDTMGVLYYAEYLHIFEQRQWFKDNPQRVREILNENPSYVFFRYGSRGPTGAMGHVVDEWLSLAVDRSYIPLGAVVAFGVNVPDEKYGSLPLRGIGFAQDVGGAIKQRRIDLFCGGSERANYVASHLDAPGPAWVLVAR